MRDVMTPVSAAVRSAMACPVTINDIETFGSKRIGSQR